MSKYNINTTNNASSSKSMQIKGFFKRIYHNLVHVGTNMDKQLGGEQTLDKLNLMEVATYMRQNDEDEEAWDAVLYEEIFLKQTGSPDWSVCSSSVCKLFDEMQCMNE